MIRRGFVIANPASASGQTGDRLANLRAELDKRDLDFEFHVSGSPGDPERLASEAARAGFSPIVAAGGDGTAHAVANGILSAGRGSEIDLALLPLGTGRDAVRNLDLPGRLKDAVDLLGHGRGRLVDVGCVDLGAGGRRFYINSASFGASAAVAQAVNEAKARRRGRVFGPKGAFAAGAVAGALRAKSYALRLFREGTLWFEGESTFAAAANGVHFGAGMKVAPSASLDDALLDLVAVPRFPRRVLLRHLPSLYSGGYLGIPGVRSDTGRSLRVENLTETEVPVELDGEVLGQLPLEIHVRGAALRVLSPR